MRVDFSKLSFKQAKKVISDKLTKTFGPETRETIDVDKKNHFKVQGFFGREISTWTIQEVSAGEQLFIRIRFWVNQERPDLKSIGTEIAKTMKELGLKYENKTEDTFIVHEGRGLVDFNASIKKIGKFKDFLDV